MSVLLSVTARLSPAALEWVIVKPLSTEIVPVTITVAAGAIFSTVSAAASAPLNCTPEITSFVSSDASKGVPPYFVMSSVCQSVKIPPLLALAN